MSNILVFCAHSDDEAVGMGGTIQKLVEEGKDVVKIVFSYGESSHPHFREKVVINMRKEETSNASKFLGIKHTIFLGLEDMKVQDELKNKKILAEIKELIEKYKPSQIYIPTPKDPHPDHRAVNKAILKIVDSLEKKQEVYEFEVWNLTDESKPMLFIDITPYFWKKKQYMKLFTTQWQYMYALLLPVYFRAIKYGLKIGCKYAERFYRVR